MSSITPTTPAISAAVASAKKITQITQSLSSGVTNLLTELARVNVSADTDVSNSAIMAQLQALHTLVEGISTRLAAVEKRMCNTDDDVPDAIEIEPEVWLIGPDLAADEYNAYARSYNGTLGGAQDTLMPLRTSRNMYILGFPSTVGHLACLDSDIEKILRKGFGLPGPSRGCDALWTFIGAPPVFRQAWEWYSTGEALANIRMMLKMSRAREIDDAGPPTALTRKAAEAHNWTARAANGTSSTTLMAIHDERNIPVFGWPRSMEMLAQGYRRWDVLYLLEQYGESVEKEGCMRRLIEFVGADEHEVWGAMEGGKGEGGPYWEM